MNETVVYTPTNRVDQSLCTIIVTVTNLEEGSFNSLVFLRETFPSTPWLCRFHLCAYQTGEKQFSVSVSQSMVM